MHSWQRKLQSAERARDYKKARLGFRSVHGVILRQQQWSAFRAEQNVAFRKRVAKRRGKKS